MFKNTQTPNSPLPAPAELFILGLKSNFSVSISFYSALNIQNLSLKVQTVLGEVPVGLSRCTDAGTTEGKHFMCRQIARGMGFRIRTLLLGSLFTVKTSVWMNLSPCVSAGLVQLPLSPQPGAVLVERAAPISAVQVSPRTLSPCLGRGSVVCVTVLLFLWRQQQQQHREASSPSLSTRGCLFQGTFRKMQKAASPSDASTVVCQRRRCLTPWR